VALLIKKYFISSATVTHAENSQKQWQHYENRGVKPEFRNVGLETLALEA
jgi:hypothetical protein